VQNAKKPAPKVDAATLATEIQTLEKAYVLMAGANHDYNGFRVKAMGQVKAAVKMLENQLVNKAKAKKAGNVKPPNVAAVKNAGAVAVKTPAVHENQLASDAQMNAARTLLQELAPVLSKHGQAGVLAKVEKAIGDINTALKIR
jgi:hypothetical protein